MFPVVHAIGLGAAGLGPAATAVAGATPHPPPPTPASEAVVVVAGEVVEAPDHFASTASKPAGVRGLGVDDGCGTSMVDADTEAAPVPPSSTVANEGAPPDLPLPHTVAAASLAAATACTFGPLADTDFRRGEMAEAVSPEIDPWPPRTMSANEDDLARA